MQIKLGEKIRELRKRSGRTQEELAMSLGVTSQAVSRWESGGGYPDMEYIPAIANAFHVTIDELFGYDSDRKIRIQAVIAEAEKYINTRRDMEPCVKLLREAIAEFPDEAQLLMRLGFALTEMGWQKYGARGMSAEGCDYALQDVEYNSQNPYWLEAVALYERVLAMGIDGDDKLAVIVVAVQLYTTMGMTSKAEALAKKQDSVMISREVLLAAASETDMRDMYQGEALLALMRQIKAVMQAAVLSKISLHDGVGLEKLLDVARLYESILDDGRCGYGHYDLGELYVICAILAARKGDIESGLTYWGKAFGHIETYRAIRETGMYHYTAALVSKVTFPSENWPVVAPNFWQGWLSAAVSRELTDAVRADERFAKCFE